MIEIESKLLALGDWAFAVVVAINLLLEHIHRREDRELIGRSLGIVENAVQGTLNGIGTKIDLLIRSIDNLISRIQP